MTQEPDFTQIPLNNQRLIALDDLKAVSGYNRNLIVPDDLPPVLSLPQVQAPLKPRLVTGQEDGSVNVFLTGQGTGTQAPSQSIGTDAFTTTGSGIQLVGPVFTKPQLIWAILWFLTVPEPLSSSPIEGGFTLAIQGQPSGTNFGLATGAFSIHNPSTANINLVEMENTWLPNPINMSAAFPSSDTHAQILIATSLAGLRGAVGLVAQ